MAHRTSNHAIGMPARSMSIVRNVKMKKNFIEIADEACNCYEMSRLVDRKTKGLYREMKITRNRKDEDALHKFLRRSSTIGTGIDPSK